jgi:hypothetical protein
MAKATKPVENAEAEKVASYAKAIRVSKKRQKKLLILILNPLPPLVAPLSSPLQSPPPLGF